MNDLGQDCRRDGLGGSLLKELIKMGPRAGRLDAQLVALAVLSGLVALFGLLLNNVSVIIGAMVISPLLEPMYASTVYLASGNIRSSLRHFIVMFALLVFIIVMAFSVTYVASGIWGLQVTPEILTRTVGADVYTLLAVILGIVAVLSHARGFLASMIGVGIAVALVPPAVVVGICLVIYPQGILESARLTFNNVFGLLAGMLLGVLMLGRNPACRWKEDISMRNIYFVSGALVALFAIILLLSSSAHLIE
jgi:uncharacterized hydrophobic protein (TIGR00341 family)